MVFDIWGVLCPFLEGQGMFFDYHCILFTCMRIRGVSVALWVLCCGVVCTLQDEDGSHDLVCMEHGRGFSIFFEIRRKPNELLVVAAL